MVTSPAALTHCRRRSVPSPGTSLVAATEAYAVHVRAAVESIRRSFVHSQSLSARWTMLLASRWCEESPVTSEVRVLRAAWALVSMRIVGRSTGALSGSASLRDAEEWFVGGSPPPALLSDAVVPSIDHEAVKALERFLYDDRLRDLLPYILDAHGPGSRASVMKDPATQRSRGAKRAGGVFYTPSDVANYITRETVGELGWSGKTLRILDPACGSGVFLRAALDMATLHIPNLAAFEFIESSLYGIDVDPLAIDMACFVLLHECLRAGHRSPLRRSPWSMWHRIRCNLFVADALSFHRVTPDEDRSESLCSLRATLDDAYRPPSSDSLHKQAATDLFSRGIALGSAFPSLAQGADVVIGNPPYAGIGLRSDASFLERKFASLPVGNTGRSDYFPVFVEMMWRFARSGRSSSGMVVPLSLACSNRLQMKAVRHAIVASGGRWRFAFFDREPHGLFGEEVKTRNAILFRYQDTDETLPDTTIETGPLRKWTSRQRSRLFDAIDFTRLADNSITAGIPKLSGALAVEVFTKLPRRTVRLCEMCTFVSSRSLEEATLERQDPRVFVSGTAYNFLNVFRIHRSLPPRRAQWSESKVIALDFSREDEAAAAFAILSSRLAFWLWHVTQDGFHVTRDFVMNLPLSTRLLDGAQREALASLGADLWDDIQHQQIVSVNGGRQTVAYRPHASDRLRDRIDALLVTALRVTPTFGGYLRNFTHSVVVVDDDPSNHHADLFPEDDIHAPHN